MRTILNAAAVAAILVGAGALCSAQTLGGSDIFTAEDARTMATSSWYGGTGLIVIPTAKTADPQRVQAHFHRVDRTDATATAAQPADWLNTWGANVGFTDDIEGGFTHLDYLDETVFQAKIRLDLGELLEIEDAPQVAIGGRDVSDEVDRALYVVVSKDCAIKEERPALLTLHLGYGDTSLPNSPLEGIFAGVDFTPIDYMRVQIEHDGENLNAAVRYWWSKWLLTDVGSLDGDFGFGATIRTDF